MNNKTIKPGWLKIKIGGGSGFARISKIIENNRLHTICGSGKCPNIGRCWNSGTATFMILGDICTRSCKFCATETGKPDECDAAEPCKIAEGVMLMNLKYCVLTSVTRDDLHDKGAGHWSKTILSVRKANPETVIEVLIPDFDNIPELLDTILDASPDIIGHNTETVERLTPVVRNKAEYRKSLKVLEYLSRKGAVTKSGIMVGLGETREEVIQTMSDVRNAGCVMFTIGQYLRPTKRNIGVNEYVTPETFEMYKSKGKELGFDHVESGPLVRSSYMAERSFLESRIDSKTKF